jgi:hypothetical protein
VQWLRTLVWLLTLLIKARHTRELDDNKGLVPTMEILGTITAAVAVLAVTFESYWSALFLGALAFYIAKAV